MAILYKIRIYIVYQLMDVKNMDFITAGLENLFIEVILRLTSNFEYARTDEITPECFVQRKATYMCIHNFEHLVVQYTVLLVRNSCG